MGKVSDAKRAGAIEAARKASAKAAAKAPLTGADAARVCDRVLKNVLEAKKPREELEKLEELEALNVPASFKLRTRSLGLLLLAEAEAAKMKSKKPDAAAVQLTLASFSAARGTAQACVKEAAKCLLSHWALVSSARALIDFKMQAGEHSEAGEDREVLQKAGAQVCTPPARAPR